MHRRQKRGLTLLEAIVVLLVIGVLVALLLPAIGSSRGDGSRKAHCTNNLNQMAAALLVYDTNQQRFPGYWSPHPVQAEEAGGSGMSWVSSILPYFEQQQFYDLAYGPESDASRLTPSAIPYIPTLICPSNMPESKEGGPNSYVANCGRADVEGPRNPAEAIAAAGPPDWAGNGLFTLRAPSSLRRADPRLDQSITSGEIADGVSNTLLISENLHAGPWWTAPPIETPSWNLLSERALGFVWYPELDPRRADRPAQPARAINSDDRRLVQAGWKTDRNFARPSSNHSGGCVIAACADRSVRTISENIDYRVYCQLMTSDSTRLGEPGGAPGPPAGASWATKPVDAGAL